MVPDQAGLPALSRDVPKVPYGLGHPTLTESAVRVLR